MTPVIDKIRFKIETPWSILVHKINKIILGKRKADAIKWANNCKNLRKRYFKNGLWNFCGIRLPDYNQESIDWFIYSTYMDSLFVYSKHNDNYDSLLIDQLDQYLPEGTYCYRNKEIDVTIKPNDVIIDAGAWIGDFSAYASTKGAKVYAFEPCKETVKYLEKTQQYNGNIEVIEKGLGDKSGIFFLSNNNINSGANQISESPKNSEKIEVTTIDEFVNEYHIEHLDFIKADIEGFERYMLSGATEVLRKMAPKLAICTYHLPDDPDVLARIILDANPNYIIVQKRKKLYAMVKPKVNI